jgi:hypothetical protein
MPALRVEHFKRCHVCSYIWETSEQWITDPKLRFNTYLADFEDPGKGRILVTHTANDCGAILAVRAADLREHYHGSVHAWLNRGNPTCKGLCLDETRTDSCDAECSMHWVRELLQALYRHQLP